jgi:5-hydroxyisourate hydrolase
MSMISTHVLNLATGLPARNLSVVLETQGPLRAWRKIGDGRTDADGRVEDLVPHGVRIPTGLYRLTFDVASYFRQQSTTSFYPEITITFGVQDSAQRHHIPLLIGPFGYTTYRGS